MVNGEKPGKKAPDTVKYYLKTLPARERPKKKLRLSQAGYPETSKSGMESRTEGIKPSVLLYNTTQIELQFPYCG
jgi:hypothetical protein